MVKQLKEDKYIFGGYRLFYVYEPKKRKILAATFRDRIVHTWYVQNYIEKYFVSDFINTSYACIKGRGVHKCLRDVKKAIYNCSKKHTSPYIIKMDVLKFFQNIDRDIIYEIISKKVKDKSFLQLTKSILNSSRLYDEVENISLPIGNYTSQMFANILLNEVDKYIKEELKCKYYFRYMDDSLVICKDKNSAKEILEKINKYYNNVLKLQLNSKTQIFKLRQGVNFCGYKIGIDKIKIRNRGKKKLIKKLKLIGFKYKTTNTKVIELKTMLAGHIGYIKHADIGGIINKYFTIDLDDIN